jgi:hypothetical protein
MMRLLFGLFVFGQVACASAQQIAIGLGGDVTSIDPHYHPPGSGKGSGTNLTPAPRAGS